MKTKLRSLEPYKHHRNAHVNKTSSSDTSTEGGDGGLGLKVDCSAVPTSNVGKKSIKHNKVTNSSACGSPGVGSGSNDIVKATNKASGSGGSSGVHNNKPSGACGVASGKPSAEPSKSPGHQLDSSHTGKEDAADSSDR